MIWLFRAKKNSWSKLKTHCEKWSLTRTFIGVVSLWLRTILLDWRGLFSRKEGDLDNPIEVIVWDSFSYASPSWLVLSKLELREFPTDLLVNLPDAPRILYRLVMLEEWKFTLIVNSCIAEVITFQITDYVRYLEPDPLICECCSLFILAPLKAANIPCVSPCSLSGPEAIALAPDIIVVWGITSTLDDNPGGCCD